MRVSFRLIRPTSISKHRVAPTVQIFLYITRSDLAKKGYEKAKKWAEDDLLLQLIESTINPVTGKEAHSDLYTEQLANPSVFDEGVHRSRCDGATAWGGLGGEVGSGEGYQSRRCRW